jgi:hypothetical protein
MTHESIEDIQAALREASIRVSTEMAAAIDLYVLEKGPFTLERDGDGYMFVVKQDVRLRLKAAEEIRAEARADVFRVFNSVPDGHSITDPEHLHFCAECHALRHIYERGQSDERTRIRKGVLEYFNVAPAAAEPLLRIIDSTTGGKDA